MHIEDLKFGMYELYEDVKNPKADRRKASRNFSAAPVWQKGKRVCVKAADFDHPDLWNVFRVGGYEHDGVRGRKNGQYNHPGFGALISALLPVEWTEQEWVAVNVNNGNCVLEDLLKSGKISRKDILEVLGT